jgi:quinolinate synthase
MVTHESSLAPEVVSDAHQLREILVGARALLQHPHRIEAVTAARGAVGEAAAIIERLTAQLDAHAVITAENERAERLQREQAAKSAGSVR